MRRKLLAAAIALFGFSPCIAYADASPGGACSPDGLVQRGGGAETAGVGHTLVCKGSIWKAATSFDGDAWRQYVPIRFPDTIVVEEAAPPGAVAVAINRTHPHQDLYLPINAAEKRLFDAIDGIRSIGEIARAHGDTGVARSFFEHLWWYDQIVLDASSPGPEARDV